MFHQPWLLKPHIIPSLTSSATKQQPTQQVRHFKVIARKHARKLPSVYPIVKIHATVREAWGKEAGKIMRERGWVPTSIKGSHLPNVDLVMDRSRLEGLDTKGLMENGHKFLILIHNKHNKMIEAVVSELNGYNVNHILFPSPLFSIRDLPERMWWNRTSDSLDKEFELKKNLMILTDPEYQGGVGATKEELKWMPKLTNKDIFMDEQMKEKAYRIMQKRAKREAAIEALKAKGEDASHLEAIHEADTLDVTGKATGDEEDTSDDVEETEQKSYSMDDWVDDFEIPDLSKVEEDEEEAAPKPKGKKK